MTATIDTSPDTAQLTAASALQKVIPDLVGLTLVAKQAHWNLTGPGFLPLHELTDEIAADARDWTDRVAERAVAIGFAVDARPGTVASAADHFPAGPVADHEVIAELGVILDRIITKTRHRLAGLDDADPVSHDIIVEVLEGLEKYRWMLRAQAL
jgi:starvation-inducible DNA-binding protein